VKVRVEIFFHIDLRWSCYSKVGMDLPHLQLMLAVKSFSIGQVVKKTDLRLLRRGFAIC
jgi:hypothetical protein